MPQPTSDPIALPGDPSDQPSLEDVPERVASHHGELPDTLMNLALAHIKTGGTEKLSLRALAREAGVSATAPYRHFPTKQCLFAAIATEGFQRLGALNSEIAARELVVEERFIQLCTGYIRFAQDNPSTYHLMFGSVLGDFSEYEMLSSAVESSFEPCNRIFLDIISSHDLNVEPEQFGGAVWATVHGMASLLINNNQIGRESSNPMRALAALKEDPEASLRLLFAQFVRAES